MSRPERRTGVITYDTPHLKTEQVALGLALRGLAFDLLAIPFRPRPARPVRFAHRPDMAEAPHPERLGAALDRPFRRFENVLDLPRDYDLFVIAGAGILPGEIVSAVCTVNAHPGLVPAVRGLDAFKWAIHDGEPLGVTLHLLDEAVDRGTPIAYARTPVFTDDTLQRLARRHYETEMNLLVDYGRWLAQPMPIDPGISERASRLRMPVEAEAVMLERFEGYRARFAGCR